jgi:KDO2-lipid IV(A) lauroyltransferase
MCLLQRRNRRILLCNLEIAFGDERSARELKRLRRKIFQNFAVVVTDFLRLPLVNCDNLAVHLAEGSLEAIERLGHMPSSSNPVISTTAHLGNWELGAAATGLLAGPITVLVDSHPSPLVTSFFNDRRADKGIEVVPVTAFHRCFRALKEGHLVAIVGDRAVTGQGIMVKFFGREALVPDGHAVLARRFGALVIPTFLVMTPDGRYKFMMEDPIVPRVTDDAAGDVRDCVERAVRAFEKYIRAYPEQWYVFRPVWGGPVSGGEDRQQRRAERSTARSRRRAARGAPRRDRKDTDGRREQ